MFCQLHWIESLLRDVKGKHSNYLNDICFIKIEQFKMLYFVSLILQCEVSINCYFRFQRIETQNANLKMMLFFRVSEIC